MLYECQRGNGLRRMDSESWVERREEKRRERKGQSQGKVIEKIVEYYHLQN